MEVHKELFDLHTHTTRSDGVLSPMQLTELARRSGLQGFAITDHDALPDVELWNALERDFDIEVIAGVELSTLYQGKSLHLLGYGFDAEDPALRLACRRTQEQRRERWVWMTDRLAEMGVKLDAARVRAIGGSLVPGRLHLARELVRSRYAGNVQSAFSRYLSAFTETGALTTLPIGEAIELLHGAGGMAVLAHPQHWLTGDDLKTIIGLGLDGLETRHRAVTVRRRQHLSFWAEEYGLIATGGSDYHGEEAGHVMGLYTVGRETIDKLHSRPSTVSIPA